MVLPEAEEAEDDDLQSDRGSRLSEGDSARESSAGLLRA